MKHIRVNKNIQFKKSDKTQLLILVGISFLLSHSIVLYLTFLAAWFNDYTVTVAINRMGEAGIEFLFLPVSLVFGIWSFKKVFEADVEIMGDHNE